MTVSLDNKTLGGFRLDDLTVLDAMGLELEDEKADLSEEVQERVKYEKIAYIKGKSSDVAVFCKWVLDDYGEVVLKPYLRVYVGEYYYEFYLDSEASKRLERAIRKVRYRFSKTKRINQCAKEKRERAFLDIVGKSLRELLR